VRVGVSDVLREALDLCLPAVCGGCGAPGRPWCADCADEVRAALAAGPTRTVVRGRGDPVPVWAAAPYDGAVAAAVVAYKDADRRDLRRVLAPLLAAAVRAAVPRGPAAGADRAGRGSPVWCVVPVPSSREARRRRGDAPLDALGRAAVTLVRRDAEARGRTVDVTWARPLRVVRPVADQSALDRSAPPARGWTCAGCAAWSSTTWRRPGRRCARRPGR